MRVEVAHVERERAVPDPVAERNACVAGGLGAAFEIGREVVEFDRVGAPCETCRERAQRRAAGRQFSGPLVGRDDRSRDAAADRTRVDRRGDARFGQRAIPGCEIDTGDIERECDERRRRERGEGCMARYAPFGGASIEFERKRGERPLRIQVDLRLTQDRVALQLERTRQRERCARAERRITGERSDTRDHAKTAHPMIERSPAISKFEPLDRSVPGPDAPGERTHGEALDQHVDREREGVRHRYRAIGRLDLDRQHARTQAAENEAPCKEPERIPPQRDVGRFDLRRLAAPGDALRPDGTDERAGRAVDLERAAASCDELARQDIDPELCGEERGDNQRDGDDRHDQPDHGALQQPAAAPSSRHRRRRVRKRSVSVVGHDQNVSPTDRCTRNLCTSWP